MEVLFEDNHLLAVSKPAGMLTQPSPLAAYSLENLAKEWVKEKYQKPGAVYLTAVHRIDRPVSGVVLFARTSKAAARLNASMREKSVEKVYLALVEGRPQQACGVLEHYLVHGEHRSLVADKKTEGAKRAVLSYRRVQTSGKWSLLRIELETGRYHQIRVQLAELGCPIVGDERYGAAGKLDGKRIALHHARLVVPHPTQKVPIVIEADALGFPILCPI